MICKNLNYLNTWADAQLSKYFPSVRKVVLIIVIPAFIIVMIYFFNVATEVAAEKKYRDVLEYEKRLAGIKKDLPIKTVVNYVSNSNERYDLINTEYVLIPVRVVAGLKPRQDFLIYQSFNQAMKPKFKGYTLKKNYGNGVILFKRNKR
jgi:hypothetical protein